MIELDHRFARDASADDNYLVILDLDRLVACVQGGQVVERMGPDIVRAEILVRMASMSMTFAGTVEISAREDLERTVVLAVRSAEVGGTGTATADVRLMASDGGGSIQTRATITGKAASMGEGVVRSVLDALIQDFARKLGST